MRRAGEIAGLPVVVVDSGLVIGRVKELVFDFGHGRLAGFVVGGRDGVGYLPFDQVYSLGGTAVTVGVEAVFVPLDSVPAPVKRLLEARNDSPRGRRVLTRTGRMLGRVEDILLDAESGAVWGYELTGGFIDDFINGRKAVPLTDEIVTGPDTLVVPDDGQRHPAERHPTDGGGAGRR